MNVSHCELRKRVSLYRLISGICRQVRGVFAVVAVGFVLTAISVTAGGLRVAVFSPAGDRDLESVCVAALSMDEGLQILDRRDLDALLGEQALQQAMGSPRTAAFAGRLLGAEILISVRKTASNLIALEGVNPLSGRILGRIEAAPEALGGRLRTLLAEDVVESSRPTVAVGDFAGTGFRRSAELREILQARGFKVLDRAIIEHAVAESVLVQSGFTQGTASSSLLGADYWVRGEMRAGKLGLHVLDMGLGTLLAVHEFDADDGSAVIAGWLDGLLPKPSRRNVSFGPIVQVEALLPLYEGIASFRDGDLRVALLSFWRAQELDDKFLEALEWEARCYDALNLPRLGAAMRRYSRECLVGRGISVPTRNLPVDGITFLGIQADVSPAVEMKAVNALLAAAPGRVVLPEHLSVYRAEYDALIGGVAASPGWTRAPGFLTRWSLRGTPAPGGVLWTLFDTLSGRIVANVESEELPFARLLSEADGRVKAENTERPSVRGLNVVSTKEFPKTSGDKLANLALIQRLAATPTSPDLWGASFRRGDSERDGLAGFLNYALREQLIATLPADNLQRAWLELIQIGNFLPWEPTGRLFSGEVIDPVKALRAFIERHADDAPGAVARYILLWEVMEDTPRDQLIQLCATTEEALRTAFEKTAWQPLEEVKTQTAHLEVLAKLAVKGPWLMLHEMPREPNPRRVRPQLKPNGQVELDYTTFWVCNEWNRVESPRDCWRGEAIAALHILGRRNNLIRVPTTWLEESPDSIALLDFAVESLHEVDYAYGAPFLHSLDMEAQRENYLRILDYCERGLPRWMERVRNESEFRFLTGYTAARLINHLTRYGFMDAVSDERFLKIQASTTADIRKAAQRLGVSPERGLGYWSRMPRRQPVDTWSVWVSSVGTPCEYSELMAREAAAAKRSWVESPAVRTEWWDFMRGWDVGPLRTQKQAQMAFQHYGEMQRAFPAKDVALYGYQETAFIFDYAYTLFTGRLYADAEPWFRLLSDAPESVLLKTPSAREIRESARLYLAYCLVSMGRPDEALALAKRCAVSQPAGEMPLRMLEHIRSRQSGSALGNRGQLQGIALRLVRDLRLAANLIDLPSNIRGFQIPITDGAGAKITFFLRIPPGLAKAEAASRPLLVIVPSLNHGAEEYMQDTNEWARFADEQGFLILVPEFNWTAAEISNAYQVAADWSGKALLDAVEWVGREYPQAATRRLLVHGYGGGGQFVQRFARWAPERCLAVSAHSAGSGSWMDGMPGLQPFSALRGVPLLVTCGTDDDLSACFYDRLAFSAQYVAAARGAGVPIIWKPLKAVGHHPDEMEGLARLFLATCARSITPGRVVYVGDLRNGHVWPTTDSRVNAIPEKYRQNLPTEELAEAWRRGY